LQAHETRRFKVVTSLYRAVPPLKYWGLRRGYLTRTGWIRSNWAKDAVDASGDPLPWLPYPAIEFLRSRVQPSMRVFEYGSGQSTRWWARHVESVHAVEDDSTWFGRVADALPGNVDLRLADSSGKGYAQSISERETTFDIVVIDGAVRNECARACVAFLAPDGVIVWDNTEEPNAFGEGLEFLGEQGFRRLDFCGIGPMNMDQWATSVLYRPGQNCFGI
jgi:hypothetical protein